MVMTEASSELADARSHLEVEKEARLVGIKGPSTLTLGSVDRRRSQLWSLAFCGLVVFAVGLGFLTSGDALHLGIANTIEFRIGTVVLVGALAAYVMDKEHHLRRLSRMLVDERVHAEAMGERLNELRTLAQAANAMNSVLVIEEVLKFILLSAFDLLHALGGSITLLEDSDTLAVVCAIGHASADQARIKVGEGFVGQVARRREPMVVQGSTSLGGALQAESAVGVPLIHRGELFGVLTLTGSADRLYTEYDMRCMSMFGGHAAMAIANARLHEAERDLTTRLSRIA